MIPASTCERLALALDTAGAPPKMIAAARAGRYDDFRSESPTPIMDLVSDLNAIGLRDIAERAANGEFDATPEEADAWAASPAGQAVLGSIGPVVRGPS